MKSRWVNTGKMSSACQNFGYVKGKWSQIRTDTEAG